MADKSKTNLFSTRNVLIGSGISLLLLAVWVIWYRNKRQELFNAILTEIRTPADTLKSGITGTIDDLWSADFWEPAYISKPGHSHASIDIATAKRLNERIYAAKGFGILPDKEDDVIAVFQGLKNRTDIAKLADAWRMVYKKPFKEHLQSFMNNETVWFSDRKNWAQSLMSTIEKLPI